ncbi:MULTISPECIES: two-component system response regulator [Aquitalea]|uniref:response regulator n=1 Tax=Aquitalea TaxID=407217 RepID=UPI00135CA247|nr:MULTISPECIES: two-component system response regulator [Aquitalea]
MTPMDDSRPILLLVDDEPNNLQVLRHILQEQYRLLFARDGDKALQLARSEMVDLILLDVMMPGMTGLEVCHQLKQDPATAAVPVIFVTALSDSRDEAEGFAAGGVDYITKPVSPPIVQARVRTHLSLVRVEELVETRLQIIQRLGRAAEFKDNETGLHVIRMSHYSRELALAAGCSARFADDLLNAAPMHDIGKIGIPDTILQKPGKLDEAEWKIMRSHAEIGARIIGDDRSSLLRMAATIALSHHERWDGTGYPHGLQGEVIPLEARIVAIADVFDALTSKRPYKHAWTVDEAFALIESEAGKHFDPALARCFLGLRPQLEAIRQQWLETL